MDEKPKPVMNGWLWCLLAATCLLALTNTAHGTEKKPSLELAVSAFEHCMERSCRDKARPVVLDGIRGVALDVRGEHGERLQCAILEQKGGKSFGVIMPELVLGSRRPPLRVFVGVSREGYLEGALIEGVGKIEAWELPLSWNFIDRERAAHECFEAAWEKLIPEMDKEWAKMQKRAP